jgi:acyl carrier protein
MLNKSFDEKEILDMIQEEIDLILEERGLPAKRIGAADRLSADLALKSLELARLVAALEVRTGADPFQELVSITSVRSVGDLQEAYRRFFAGDSAVQDSEELLDAQRRAAARKALRGTGL